MLQRLYNWVKYKSQPASFLFKNRLFIERNTKNRRIYSIFGALTRNSKWGNFELTNLKLQFRLNYTKYLLWISLFCLLLFFGWFFKNYYISVSSFNSVALFIWLSIDSFDYYLSFGLWIVTALIAIITNWIYSYFLERVNFKRTDFKIIFSDTFFASLIRPEDIEPQRLLFTATDLKYLLYSWLSRSSHRDKSIFLENFFNLELNKIYWNNCYDFFIKLFKVTYLCNLSNETQTVHNLHYIISNLYPLYLNSNFKNLFIYYRDVSVVNKYSTLIFWCILNNYTNYYSYLTCSTPSLNLLRTRNNWNLGTFDIEIDNYNIFNINVLGNFYLSSFSFNALLAYSNNFIELWNISSFIKNQINAAKWNRWLYKYSILHRRFLKNSHKITLTKKLFASGFYDNKYFSRNAWNSAHLKGINKIFLHNLSSLYYKNLFSHTSLFTLQTQNLNTVSPLTTKESINLFSFYENSYLWVAKRFYYFNTISSNNFYSSTILKTNVDANKLKIKTSVTWYFILNSYLNSLYSINMSTIDLTYTNLTSFKDNNYFLDNNFAVKNNYYFKDLYLLFDDNDLLTQEVLDINYWITNSLSTTNNVSCLSNYLINNPSYYRFKNNNHFSSSIMNWESNTFKPLINTMLVSDIYLFDVVLLTYFY